MKDISAKASIRVRRPVVEVFSAFADPEKMGRYWFTRRDDGLKQGESVSFFMGPAADAFSFDVQVIAFDEPHRIEIEWGGPDEIPTQVTFTFDETDAGDTLLAVEETGFGGGGGDTIQRALDSTGGFNQVIVAAKAFIEHGVEVNVVSDHA
jgi:uncharacterized protein YndB with AHSA1/START domain